MIKLALILVIAPFICIDGYTVQPRIINGNLTNPEGVPWFAHININDFNCGATLISDRWAVTAAHCLRLNQAFLLRIGIKENYNAFAEKYISTFDQYIHPKYANVSTTPYDIGLIKLAKIEPNPFAKPIQLPMQCSDDFDGIDVVAIGNGRDSIYELYADGMIRQAEFKTISSVECERRLAMSNISVKHDGMLCAEPGKYGESVYHGDSGGLLLRKPSGDMIGIASFISGDNRRIQLQVWTKIQAYYDWISELTGLDLPKC